MMVIMIVTYVVTQNGSCRAIDVDRRIVVVTLLADSLMKTGWIHPRQEQWDDETASHMLLYAWTFQMSTFWYVVL